MKGGRAELRAPVSLRMIRLVRRTPSLDAHQVVPHMAGRSDGVDSGCSQPKQAKNGGR
jgi:hypothetical protein